MKGYVLVKRTGTRRPHYYGKPIDVWRWTSVRELAYVFATKDEAEAARMPLLPYLIGHTQTITIEEAK